MSCIHCAFDCKKKGEDINIDFIFKAISDIKKNFKDSSIYIGGGEPTLHPQFLKIFEYIVNNKFNSISMITNGTADYHICKKIKYWYKNYNDGIIDIMVSDDIFHNKNMIKPWWGDFPKNVLLEVIFQGRAEKNKKEIIKKCAEAGESPIFLNNIYRRTKTINANQTINKGDMFLKYSIKNLKRI